MKPPRSPSQGTPPGRVREPVQVYLDPPDRERLERLTPDLGMSQSEVLRKGLVVTHPRVFDPPAPLDTLPLAFAEAWENIANAVSVSRAPATWRSCSTWISATPSNRRMILDHTSIRAESEHTEGRRLAWRLAMNRRVRVIHRRPGLRTDSRGWVVSRSGGVKGRMERFPRRRTIANVTSPKRSPTSFATGAPGVSPVVAGRGGNSKLSRC